MRTRQRQTVLAIACLAWLIATPVPAGASVLVLDFGLNDDTLLPRVPIELARTAAVAPAVRARLAARGHTIVSAATTPEIQAQASNGYKYFVEHPLVAAALGQAAGAEWVAIGRVNKPSFLFAYFVIDLVDAATGRIVAHLETSPRGAISNARLQTRAAEALADEVHRALVTVLAHRAKSEVPTTGTGR